MRLSCLERWCKDAPNSDEIQQILPHRYPFLLVDRITECEPGKKACGIKCVSANEMHFVGTFSTEEA